MKAVQIEVDEQMLNDIARNEKFRAMNLSEFFHGAGKFILKWYEEREIDKQYQRAYGDPRAREAFDREVEEWLEAQVWSD